MQKFESRLILLGHLDQAGMCVLIAIAPDRLLALHQPSKERTVKRGHQCLNYSCIMSIHAGMILLVPRLVVAFYWVVKCKVQHEKHLLNMHADAVCAARLIKKKLVGRG